MTDEHVHPFPWRLMGLVAIIVIIATVAAGLVLSRNSVEQEPPPDASVFTPAPGQLPVEKLRQVTVLLQVRDRDRAAVSNVLIGVGGDTGYVAELILPRNLLLPTVPPLQLKDVDGPTGPVSAEGPIEVLLGVQVDAAVEMDRLAWAGLLDSIGAAPGTAHAADPASFPLVLDSVLSRLPADEQAIGQLLTSLGSMARTTVTNEDASHLLAVLGEGLRTQEVRREVLPVLALRAGPAQVAIIQQPEGDEAVQRLFPRALLQPGHPGTTRVVIERAGGSLGAATSARLALAGAGFGVVVQGGDAAVTESAVLVPVGTEAALAHGRDVAAVLGLPPTSVAVDESETATVDVRVVLGSGFRPM